MNLEINNVYHGDCLDLMPNIADKSIDMILCDLPYGTTACSWDVVIPFEPLWTQYKRIIKNNGAIVLFGSQPFTTLLISSNFEMFKYEWIWDKKQTGNPFMVNMQPLKVHENILVFNNHKYIPQMKIGQMRIKGGANINNIKIFGATDKKKNNKYYPLSILEIANCSSKNNKIHPTQKPVKLFEYLILTYTNEGDTVLDNCAGSGTTAIACLNSKRNYILIEKEKKYIDIINKRIREWEPRLF